MRRLPVLLLALGLVIPLFAETLGSTGLDLGYRQFYNLQFDRAQATGLPLNEVTLADGMGNHYFLV